MENKGSALEASQIRESGPCNNSTSAAITALTHDNLESTSSELRTVQRNTHTHTHNGAPADIMYLSPTPHDVPAIISGAVTSHTSDVLTHDNPLEHQAVQKTVSVKGSRKILRRGGRNSCSESEDGELAAVAHEKVLSLLKQYHQDGGVKELAAFAREKGIPAHLRKEVWPVLLRHHPCVLDKHIAKEYPIDGQETGVPREIPVKRIRGDLARYHRRVKNVPNTRNATPPSSTSPNGQPKPDFIVPPDPALLDQAALDTAVEDAIVSFLEKHEDVKYSSGMVHVCLTLADWLFIPPSITESIEGTDSLTTVDGSSSQHLDSLSVCFEQMMYVTLWAPVECSTPLEPSDSFVTQQISHFLTTFRQLMPELARYFDEEDVASFREEWVFSWIQWWCTRELGKTEKGRLWDWYLGFDKPEKRNGATGEVFVPGEVDGLPGAVREAYYPCDWHILVCVALLKSCKDALEELEQSEIRTLLSRLPKVNMDLIIKEAKSLRKELQDIILREEEEYAISNASTTDLSGNGGSL
ncbi:hypothetical protein RUND412_011389 [Rhizina undulata]